MGCPFVLHPGGTHGLGPEKKRGENGATRGRESTQHTVLEYLTDPAGWEKNSTAQLTSNNFEVQHTTHIQQLPSSKLEERKLTAHEDFWLERKRAAATH
ncbi:hypothetical protein VIGAN_03151100 [Vigna angularis var. angularis]|uniref:Uncharacterized protein n=1 Tax=Vigna angularis var. angularis TaxID=157739 RepID=A0A0S3RMA7_PHAAN|nr:hypothetical protein VIGAN_03151100 [Vigna angularis var. angularis]